VTGKPDTEAGGGPLKVGVALVDIITGLYASNAILAALRHRDATGKGQHIDMALLDCIVAALANQSHSYLQSGVVPPRLGNAHPSIAPYESFPTSDGHIMLAIGNDGQFKRFCKLAGLDGLSEDPQYASNKSRVENRAALIPLLAERTRSKPSKEWIDILSANAVPCGPINTLDTVFADPQIKHREVARRLPHKGAGSVASVANPIHMSETPVEYRMGPPVLGEHTTDVLRDILGFADDEIAALNAKGAINR